MSSVVKGKCSLKFKICPQEMTLLDNVGVSAVYSNKIGAIQYYFIFYRTGVLICHLNISHNAPYLPPKILRQHGFQFLLGRLLYPGEMKNKGYAKFWGEIRCIMGDGQVVNRPVSKYQNSYLALRLMGTTPKK